MSDIAIKFENISKQYRLGTISTGTLSHDLNRWWAMNIRGKDDPNLKIGQVNDRAAKSTEDYVWALRDIDFEVKQGEVLGIIGKNGAGKSTLLKILSRVTTPTTGRIIAYGRIASLLEVGTGFHPEMTGRENIYMNGTIMGMRRWEIDKKFDEIVDFAGVEKYIDTPVKRYSSGMTVRLGFAIAAHLEPEILVVDEVLAVGDAEFQKKALGKMQEVSKGEGRTVIFVSHNMYAVRRLCDRVIQLRNGVKVADDYSTKVIEQYLKESNQNAEGIKNLDEIIRNLPLDPVFKLEGITLFQNGNNVKGLVENSIPLEIEIRYRIFEKINALRIFFDLLDEERSILFRSLHDEHEDRISISNPGQYVSTAIIPANLLATKTYEVRICAAIHNVRSILQDNVIIPVEISSNRGINRAYGGEINNIKLQPSIFWKTITLNSK